MSFWGAGQVYILIGSKVITRMKNIGKTQKKTNQNHQNSTWIVLFFTKLHKNENEMAPQNDTLNLSFVKYIDGKNLAWNGSKTTISQSTYFWDTVGFLQNISVSVLQSGKRQSVESGIQAKVAKFKAWFCVCHSSQT